MTPVELPECAPGEAHCSCAKQLHARYAEAVRLLALPRSRPMRSSEWNAYGKQVEAFLEVAASNLNQGGTP